MYREPKFLIPFNSFVDEVVTNSEDQERQKIHYNKVRYLEMRGINTFFFIILYKVIN